MEKWSIDFEENSIIRDSLLKLYLLGEKVNETELRITKQEAEMRASDELSVFAENRAFPQYVMFGKTWYSKSYFDIIPDGDLLSQFPCSENMIQLPVYMNLLAETSFFVEYDESNLPECQKFTHNIIWSFLSGIPVSKICISIFDCERRGSSVIPFLEFKKVRPIYSIKKYIPTERLLITDLRDSITKLTSAYSTNWEQNIVQS